jgi:hypothetical protein
MSAVLDQVAVSTDTYTPAVGAQWMGQARDIRRRIAAEDTQYDRLVAALVAPVKDRLHRFPHRSLRQQMLVDLVQRWRFMAPRDWRLDLDAKLDKACATLIEHRLVAGVMRRKDDPNWVGIEEDLAIIRVELLVNRSSAHLESHCIATFSLHAIARRLQRHPDGSVESLMHDPCRRGRLRGAPDGRRGLQGDDRRARRRLARSRHQPDRSG